MLQFKIWKLKMDIILYHLSHSYLLNHHFYQIMYQNKNLMHNFIKFTY